jgi:hypothetical protein
VIVAGTTRALHNEHVSPSHVVADLDRELSVAEANYFEAPQLDTKRLTD